MKYCSKCGKQLADDAKFCVGCGASVESSNVNANFNLYGGSNVVDGPMTSSNNNAKMVAIISIIAAAISSFLPFFTVSVLGFNQSISLVSKNLMETAVFLYILLAYALFRTLKMKSIFRKEMITVGILVIIEIILIYKYNQYRLSSSTVTGVEYDLSSLLSLGIGFYLLIASSIGFIVAGILYRED